jgi:photosystem II stability/assembly factor-like uncharacterized protein
MRKYCLFVLGLIMFAKMSYATNSWTIQYSGIVYDISFPDSLHGWAAGGKMTGTIHGRVLYTNDGGKNWTEKAVGNIEDTIVTINRISFSDSLIGCAGGSHAKMSTGGWTGQSWLVVSTGDGFNTCGSMKGPIWSHYDGGGISVMESGGFFWANFHSDCNGMSYFYINGFQMDSYVISLSFADSLYGLYGWAYLSDGGFYRTTTGVYGLTHLYNLSNISDIDFIDSLHGWAVGSSGKILYTDNGGAYSIWQPESSGVTKGLTCVQFIDSLNGWVGGSGVILRTRDGGKTWATEYSSGSRSVSRICAVDTSYVWALIGNTILKYKPYVGIEEKSNIKYQKSKMEIIKDKIFLSVPNNYYTNTLITIYDLCGREKETLYEGTLSKGSYVFTPNVKKSGVYFVRLSAGNIKETKKLVLVK